MTDEPSAPKSDPRLVTLYLAICPHPTTGHALVYFYAEGYRNMEAVTLLIARWPQHFYFSGPDLHPVVLCTGETIELANKAMVDAKLNDRVFRANISGLSVPALFVEGQGRDPFLIWQPTDAPPKERMS